MKFLRGQVLLVAVCFASCMSMQMNVGGVPQGNLQRWWSSTYFTDYLPNWIQSLIPRARVRQMFHGFGLYYDKIRKIDLSEGSSNESEMTKLVQSYDEWMKQYKDIINEGTIMSGLSISTGNPDSILGLWKTFLLMAYTNKWGNCLVLGIKRITENLERMGAKLNPTEEAILKPLSMINFSKPYKGE